MQKPAGTVKPAWINSPRFAAFPPATRSHVRSSVSRGTTRAPSSDGLSSFDGNAWLCLLISFPSFFPCLTSWMMQPVSEQSGDGQHHEWEADQAGKSVFPTDHDSLGKCSHGTSRCQRPRRQSLYWLLGTSVLTFGVSRLIKRAFLSKGTTESPITTVQNALTFCRPINSTPARVYTVFNFAARNPSSSLFF